jgi:hypothetical protein
MKHLFLVVLFFSVNLVYAKDDCQALLEQHLESDMDLSYQEFDQTMDSGFRQLSAQGCHSESADLIERYIEVNSAEQSSLRWHIAQSRAMAGQNTEAIRYARTTLLEEEDFSERALRWNDYVLATIAFLEGNREQLLFHREKIAEGVGEHPGNELNLRLIDALVGHSGTDYSAALKSLQAE